MVEESQATHGRFEGARRPVSNIHGNPPLQSPINRHPVTGQPVWFCNAHNHLRYLRDRRPCGVPEVGMTDVFFGDLGHLSPEECDEVKR